MQPTSASLAWRAILISWPLLIGMALLMVSNGLLSTLLTLRASGLGFGDSVIGLVQSCYPAGALLGCLVAPRMVARVGHVRVFAALASITSATTLVHLVTHDPLTWAAMRLLAGFCFSGLYVVAESWLNGSATNESRGSLLSIYFVVQTGGSAVGQAFLIFSTLDGLLLLVTASILISLSLVPMLISTTPTPALILPRTVSIGWLFRQSPMGLSGCFLNGVTQGAIYVALALYGRHIGLGTAGIGALIGVATLGGMISQFPIGRLSDRIDRRLVIVGAAGLAVPVCVALALLDQPASEPVLMYLGIVILGGLTLPIYSICAAHTNDHLAPSEILTASGTLVLILGLGMTLGPTLGSLAIGLYGPAGLFLFLATVQSCTVATALFRLWRGKPQSDTSVTTVAMAPNATPIAAGLNPDAQQLTSEYQVSPDAYSSTHQGLDRQATVGRVVHSSRRADRCDRTPAV